MNLILQIAPELEARLQRLAASTGKSVETLAVEAIAQLSPSGLPETENTPTLGLDEWNAALDQLLAGLPRTLANDVDTSRESIYSDDGR